MVDVFDAVADPTRRVMMDRLRGGPLSAGALGQGLEMSQPAVSKHLRVLREAGLVRVEQVGRQRLYALVPEQLHALEQWVAPYRAIWQQRIDALSTEIARGARARRTTEAAVRRRPRNSGRLPHANDDAAAG